METGRLNGAQLENVIAVIERKSDAAALAGEARRRAQPVALVQVGAGRHPHALHARPLQLHLPPAPTRGHSRSPHFCCIHSTLDYNRRHHCHDRDDCDRLSTTTLPIIIYLIHLIIYLDLIQFSNCVHSYAKLARVKREYGIHFL